MRDDPSAPLHRRLNDIVGASPTLMRVLRLAREADLPDWALVSGAVYQAVWNALTGRAPDYGVRDYDLFYFCAADLSYEAEDVEIRRVAALAPEPLRSMIEVRNQARVHLWFEDHFGEAYSPTASTAEAIARFASPAHAVGVRLGDGDALTVIAPFGLDDLFAMRLRPNPARPRAAGWDKVVASARGRWPEVTVA